MVPPRAPSFYLSGFDSDVGVASRADEPPSGRGAWSHGRTWPGVVVWPARAHLAVRALRPGACSQWTWRVVTGGMRCAPGRGTRRSRPSDRSGTVSTASKRLSDRLLLCRFRARSLAAAPPPARASRPSPRGGRRGGRRRRRRGRGRGRCRAQGARSSPPRPGGATGTSAAGSMQSRTRRASHSPRGTCATRRNGSRPTGRPSSPTTGYVLWRRVQTVSSMNWPSVRSGEIETGRGSIRSATRRPPSASRTST